MKLILTESQLKRLVSERMIRYDNNEDYDIQNQIEWLIRKKEFAFSFANGHKDVVMINNIILNLEKVKALK